MLLQPFHELCFFIFMWNLPRQDWKSENSCNMASPYMLYKPVCSATMKNAIKCRPLMSPSDTGTVCTLGQAVLWGLPPPLSFALGRVHRRRLINLWGKCRSSRTNQIISLILCASSLGVYGSRMGPAYILVPGSRWKKKKRGKRDR